MKPNTKHKQRRTSKTDNSHGNAMPILKAVTLGLLVTAVMLLLFSFLMAKRDMPFSLINPISVLALVAGAMTAGFTVSRQVKENGMVMGAVCGCLIFLVLLVFSSMFKFDVGTKALIKLVICGISGAMGGVVGINLRHKRKI